MVSIKNNFKMKNGVLVLIAFFFSLALQAQEKPAYLLFDSDGNEVKYSKMLKVMGKADVVLIGELHNNPISHWLQFEITRDLFAVEKNMVLGAEMFESDDQVILNEYLAGKIKERHFETEAKLWDNYKTDYKPLVNFAKTNELPFIATNVPRRYASMVARDGYSVLDPLPKSVKKWMAPLPFPFDADAPGYKEMMEMSMGHNMGMEPENMVKAQAIKDATMAYFILENREKRGIFVHYQGDYHSAFQGGIYWYLKKWNSKLDVVTISSNSSDTMEWSAEYKGKADYILLIPSSMTTTY